MKNLEQPDDEYSNAYDFGWQSSPASYPEHEGFIGRAYNRVYNSLGGVYQRYQINRREKQETKETTSRPRRRTYSQRYKVIWFTSLLSFVGLGVGTAVYYLYENGKNIFVQAPKASQIPAEIPLTSFPTSTPTQETLTQRPTEPPAVTLAPTWTPPPKSVPTAIPKSFQCWNGTWVENRDFCPLTPTPQPPPEPQVIEVIHEVPAPVQPTATPTPEPTIAPIEIPQSEIPKLQPDITPAVRPNSNGEDVEIKNLLPGRKLKITTGPNSTPFYKEVTPDMVKNGMFKTNLLGFSRSWLITTEDGTEIEYSEGLKVNPGVNYSISEEVGDDENETWTEDFEFTLQELVDPTPTATSTVTPRAEPAKPQESTKKLKLDTPSYGKAKNGSQPPDGQSMLVENTDHRLACTLNREWVDDQLEKARQDPDTYDLPTEVGFRELLNNLRNRTDDTRRELIKRIYGLASC